MTTNAHDAALYKKTFDRLDDVPQFPPSPVIPLYPAPVRPSVSGCSTMKSPTLWSAFTAEQRRNILFYSIGIMSYKFALECECESEGIPN